MDFRASDDQDMIRQMTRRFAEERLRPGIRARDEAGEFPVALHRELADLGLLGVNVPDAYGGAEAGVVAYSWAIQELARVDAAVAVTTSVTNMVAEILLAFGTEEQKRTYIPRITSGAAVAGAFALSEAGAGSDPGAMKTRVERRGDDPSSGYVANGEKMWITSGAHAGVIILFARTGEGPGTRGLSTFIVTPDLPGFHVGREEDKMGGRSSNTVARAFDDCQIPADRLLGAPGGGFKVAMAALDGGRIGIASQALGIAQGALDAAARYASERVQFGRPIAEHPSISNKLADMATQVDAARLLTLRAAWLKQAGRRYTREASMAKLYASEMANRVCGDALQIHGGYGYVKDFDVERFYREARVTTIYEGTSEVQRIVIARELLRQVAQGSAWA